MSLLTLWKSVESTEFTLYLETTLASRRRGRGKEVVTTGFCQRERGRGGEGYPQPPKEKEMLKDEKLEYIEEQFKDKAELLAEYGTEVTATEMYEDIFGDLDLVVPAVVIDDEKEDDEQDANKKTKHILPMPLKLAIQEAENRNDMLLGGCTYFNDWISKKSAKDIYTLIVDMDNVYSGPLLMALQNDWYTGSGKYLPKPTYIVNSGTGLHLYFVFKEPIPNYKRQTANLDKLYRTLAEKQTTNRVYLVKQVQWFGQDFRIAGGKNKYNWTNGVYKYGEKWDVEELAKALGLKELHFIRYGDKRISKPVSKKKKAFKKNGWHTNRAWYDKALQGCIDKTKEGNRYMSMCALSVIAFKCNVPKDELTSDLEELLPHYNKNAKRRVKPREVLSAIKMYNEKAWLTPKEILENWQGWLYPPKKVNGRKQKIHLKLARNQLAMLKELGEASQGRPNAKELVARWRKFNPEGRKVDCQRETGLSKPTVLKWWNEADEEGL